MTTVLVTGAGGPLGVNVTRSIKARDGVRLIGTDANRWHLPLSICDTTYRIPLANAGAPYRDALRKIIEREGVDVIVPTHPVEVFAVASLIEDGELSAASTLPRTQVLAVTDDKAATQRRLSSAGLAVPNTIVLDEPVDVERAFAELAPHGGPVWVRGSGAPGRGIGGAALPCSRVDVAIAWIRHHDGWGAMSASEYLPGDNLTWMAMYRRGNLMVAGSRERLEYVLPHVSPSGITGAPAVSRTVYEPALCELGDRAVRAVDDEPHGAYFVDFKGDHHGAPRVTEINAGRCGTTVHFYTEAGVNFPLWLVDIAMGAPVEPVPEPNRAIPAGLYWVRTLDCGPVLLGSDAEFDSFPSAP